MRQLTRLLAGQRNYQPDNGIESRIRASCDYHFANGTCEFAGLSRDSDSDGIPIHGNYEQRIQLHKYGVDIERWFGSVRINGVLDHLSLPR